MKVQTLTLALAVGLLGTLPVYSQKKSPGAKNTTERAKELAAQRVNPDFVSARKHFDAGNGAGCAASLKKASAKMRKLVMGSGLPAASEVVASAIRLDGLAASSESGKLKDGARLNMAFSAAHHSLAAYHRAKAEALLADKKNFAAGQSMNRTADHIEYAAKWSGQKLDSEQNAVVKGLRGVAGGLVGGAGTVVEGTGSILKKGLGVITGLGSAIKGKDKSASGNLGKDAVDGTRKVTGGVVKGAGKVGEAGAGVVEKSGGGLKKLGDKVAGKTPVPAPAPKEEAAPKPKK